MALAHWNITNSISKNDHELWSSAIHRERFAKALVSAQRGVTIDPQDFGNPRNHEHQIGARVTDEVANSIEAIVSASLRQQQRGIIMNPYNTGRVAAWGAVQPSRASCRDNNEGGGFHHRAVCRCKAPCSLADRHGSRRMQCIEFSVRLVRLRVPV
jgi:hypothetical protein